MNSEYLEIRKNLSLFKRKVQISSQHSDFDIKGQKMSKVLPFSLFPLLIGAQEVFKNSSLLMKSKTVKKISGIEELTFANKQTSNSNQVRAVSFRQATAS